MAWTQMGADTWVDWATGAVTHVKPTVEKVSLTPSQTEAKAAALPSIDDAGVNSVLKAIQSGTLSAKINPNTGRADYIPFEDQLKYQLQPGNRDNLLGLTPTSTPNVYSLPVDVTNKGRYFVDVTVDPSSGKVLPVSDFNTALRYEGFGGDGLFDNLNWSKVRDTLESAAVVAGNYLAPGSALLTAPLVSEGSQEQLSTGPGSAALIASGLAGGLSGNLSAGTQAGQAAGLTGSTASTVGNTALVGAATGDLEKAVTSGALNATGSTIGSNVAGATDSQALGQLASGTTVGLLSGQDLGSALGNAAIVTGANQAAGGLLNAFNTPTTPTVDTTYTPTTDYSTGADYTLQAPATSGLGLQATPAPLDLSNPYSFDTTAALTGGLGLNYNTAASAPNIADMGGGQGLLAQAAPTAQVPEGSTLGSIGAGNTIGSLTNTETGNPLGQELANIVTGAETYPTLETSPPTAANPNPATQNLLGKLLLAGIFGNTGTNNMATTDNNNLLGNLLGGVLTGAGGLMQSSTDATARQTQADTLRQAGQTAASQAQFRPVGTTTTFGTSNFQIDPKTGQLTSAGYTLSPQLQAYQNQIMGAGQQSLNDAAALQTLGRGYIAQTPEAAAQNWYNKQQALLQPSRDVESARLANQLQQTGRTGVSVAQGGALSAANPEYQALANARAMQDAQLAAQAQQFGQQQTQFGQGLLSSAYQPFTAGLNTAATVEGLGQQPFTMSQGLAKEASASGARAGELQLVADKAAANAALGANQYNPFADVLTGVSSGSLFGKALGNLAGSTGVGSDIATWLGSLISPSFSDTTGWSNGGNNVITLDDGTNLDLSRYFSTPSSNSGGYDNLSF